jgi:hypothetical protein
MVFVSQFLDLYFFLSLLEEKKRERQGAGLCIISLTYDGEKK